MRSDGDDDDPPSKTRSSRFVPQEDDNLVLWEVIAITAENKKSYKVRWAGVDPKTGKPWAQSWVPKHDCTNALVATWEGEKKEKDGVPRKRGRPKKSATDSSRPTLNKEKARERDPPSTTRRTTGFDGVALSTLSRVPSIVSHASPSLQRDAPKRKAVTGDAAGLEAYESPYKKRKLPHGGVALDTDMDNDKNNLVARPSRKGKEKQIDEPRARGNTRATRRGRDIFDVIPGQTEDEDESDADTERLLERLFSAHAPDPGPSRPRTRKRKPGLPRNRDLSSPRHGQKAVPQVVIGGAVSARNDEGDMQAFNDEERMPPKPAHSTIPLPHATDKSKKKQLPSSLEAAMSGNDDESLTPHKGPAEKRNSAVKNAHQRAHATRNQGLPDTDDSDTDNSDGDFVDKKVDRQVRRENKVARLAPGRLPPNPIKARLRNRSVASHSEASLPDQSNKGGTARQLKGRKGGQTRVTPKSAIPSPEIIEISSDAGKGDGDGDDGDDDGDGHGDDSPACETETEHARDGGRAAPASAGPLLPRRSLKESTSDGVPNHTTPVQALGKKKTSHGGDDDGDDQPGAPQSSREQIAISPTPAPAPAPAAESDPFPGPPASPPSSHVLPSPPEEALSNAANLPGEKEEVEYDYDCYNHDDSVFAMPEHSPPPPSCPDGLPDSANPAPANPAPAMPATDSALPAPATPAASSSHSAPEVEKTVLADLDSDSDDDGRHDELPSISRPPRQPTHPPALPGPASVVLETQSQPQSQSQSPMRTPTAAAASARATLSPSLNFLFPVLQDRPVSCPPDDAAAAAAAAVVGQQQDSIVSAMIVDADPKAALCPIPLVSPARFRPYLPPPPPPAPLRPRRAPAREETGTEPEDEYLPSSIEQFSSPEKKGVHGDNHVVGSTGSSRSSRSSSSPSTGVSAADAAGLRWGGKRMAASAAEPRARRRSRGARGNSAAAFLAFQQRPTRPGPGGQRREHGAGSDTQDDRSPVATMTASDGFGFGFGFVEGADGRRVRRMEEEESTQDLAREREAALEAVQRMAGAGSPMEVQDSVPASSPPPPTGSEADARSPMPEMAAPDTPSVFATASTDRSTVSESQVPSEAPTRSASLGPTVAADATTNRLALGLLHTKSEEIVDLEKNIARERSRAEEYARRARALESSKVKLTEEAEAQGKALQCQLAETREALSQAMAQNDELERQLERTKGEMAEMKAGWDEEKSGWQTNEAILNATIESHLRSRESLERDVAFFREQYGAASAFTSELQLANAELEQRASIATGQAKTGVAAVRALYESQVATLNGEVTRWRGLCHVLQEKDARTDDDVRRRAAEAPELRVQVLKLTERLGHAIEELETMEEEKEEWEGKARGLEAEKREWEGIGRGCVVETTELRVQVHRLTEQLARATEELAVMRQGRAVRAGELETALRELRKQLGEEGRVSDLASVFNDWRKGLREVLSGQLTVLGTTTPNLKTDEEMEEVYRCMWIESGSVCDGIFSNNEELKNHVEEHLVDDVI